jgi:alpha-galactosidase
MPIEWDGALRQLHLHNGRVSHVMRVLDNGWLGHLHFGRPLAPGRSYAHLGPAAFAGFHDRPADPVALEWPVTGSGDYRIPAIVVAQADGSTLLDPRYAGHRILPGKPSLGPLPATYVEEADEADTVEVDLVDGPSGLRATLAYSIFRDVPAIARSARLRNEGPAPLVVRTAMSASLDLPDAGWVLVQLSGAWARERHVVERVLTPGRTSVNSERGASSAQHNPFIVLRRPETTEAAGEAVGLSLVYSGDFLAEVEVDSFGTTRARLGIDPTHFAWTLEPGDELALPEAVLAWSGDGLGALSDTYHGLYRERLARGAWRDAPRPIVVNNWEGTYYDFTTERLVAMAEVAADLGIELFVLDDGWFGERDADDSSLGDWYVDRRKLPDGLAGVAERVEALGMRFGLWVEPEMVSPRSRLFAEHPDWALGIPGRPRTEQRHQLVLDMSRPEVVDHLFRVLSDVLASAPISYVKWDMNRYMTEAYSTALPPERQGELRHRHILGVYDLHARLTAAFPGILFESCASGGGRFDPGMLAFAPQGWTSDDTDAVERLRIQWGTSLAYPLSSMAAHVSAVPNHQVGRVTPLATRAAVAFFGVFGYELDPVALTDDERRAVAAQVAFYKRHRDVLQRGRFVRLRSPFEGDGTETAWMVVSDDRRRAVVGAYRVLDRPYDGPARLPLRGLDPALAYRVSPWPDGEDAVDRANARVRGGDDLMANGVVLRVGPFDPVARADYGARLFVLEAVEEA